MSMLHSEVWLQDWQYQSWRLVADVFTQVGCQNRHWWHCIKMHTGQAELVLTWIFLCEPPQWLGHCQRNFIEFLHRRSLFCGWTLSAGNTCFSLSTWMNIWYHLGRRHPRCWYGEKGNFWSIQWPNHVALACKTVSLQRSSWKEEGESRRTGN